MKHLQLSVFIFCLFYIQESVCNDKISVYNHKVTCYKPDLDFTAQIKDHDILRIASKNWASTHSIEDWKYSEWVRLDSNYQDENTLKYHIPIHLTNDAFYTETSYKSSIKMPAVVRKLFNAHVTMDITKKWYIINKNMYSVTEVTNIPVVGHVTIYTSQKIMQNGILMSKSVLSYDEIPIYVRWARNIVENHVMDSIKLYTVRLISAVCKD